MAGAYEERIAAAVARRVGLAFTTTVVLYSGTNVVVHLSPTPVVARVTRIGHLVRPVTDLAGSIALARSTAVRGCVVAPSTAVDPGPHIEQSRYVTFWSRYPSEAATVMATPAEVGAGLRRFHESARAHAGQLRSFDPRPEALKIADIVNRDIGAILRSAATSMTVPDLAQQPIHGDAHEENALAGGIWQDLDDACRGPIEWDLASLQHRRFFFGERQHEIAEALRAYGPHAHDVVEALGPAVVLAIAAWGSLATYLGEEVGPRTRLRLAWLKERFG
ncbi:MAG: phosphotransferase [Chloroflexi bacterium]|nr:phosphotransferase [Chloroflexota bacterium]